MAAPARDLGGPHRDELERPGAIRIAVALLVRFVEALGEPGTEGNGELERLARVAQVGLAVLRKLSCLRERLDVRAHGVDPLVRGDQAEGGEDPGCGRDEDRVHPQLLCEGTRMERPGTAERDEREVARIQPLLDGDDPQRPHHLGVDDLDDCGRIQLAERKRSRIGVEHEAAGQRRGQATEQEIRIGHGRLLSAEPVAGGAGCRSRALGADSQRAARVQPHDRAASRSHRVHCERREPDRESAHVSLVLAPRLAVRDRADVGGRPAHVEREGVRESGERSYPGGPDDARGWSREQREGRVLRGFLERRKTSGGAHDERRQETRFRAGIRRGRADIRPRTGPRYASTAAVDARSYSRNSGATSWEATTWASGIATPQLGRHRLLVAAVPEREEEADGDRLCVELGKRREIERLQLAVPPDATAHADRALERNERLRMLGARPVEMGASLPSQVKDVLEARCADERRPRAAPLEERVRGDRRAVREAIHALRSDRSSGRQHRLLLVFSRSHLRGPHLALRDEHGVGEGSADVDPERAHRHILCEPEQRARSGRLQGFSARPEVRTRGFRSCARVEWEPTVDRLVCLGLSHRTAPVELRERVGTLGLGAERCPGVEEHVSLTTCYRVELYAYLSGGVEEAREELIGVLAGTHGVDRGLLADHLYVHAGEDVARHLSRVSAGLDSLVLGESEILGQVGDAFARARTAGTTGPVLSLLFRTALASGRRARAETGIGANPATASSMALALAEGTLGDLRDRRVLVVGAGRIAVQSLKAARGRGVTQTRAGQPHAPAGSRGGDPVRGRCLRARAARGGAHVGGRGRYGDVLREPGRECRDRRGGDVAPG